MYKRQLANGAEEVLLPEKYDNNLEALIERVAHARELGKQQDVYKRQRYRHGGTQVLSRKRIAKLFRIC